MNSNNPSVAMTTIKSLYRFWLPLLAMLLSGNAWGDSHRYQDINLQFDILENLTDCPADPDIESEIIKFAAEAGNPLECEGLSTGCDIVNIHSFEANVIWTFEYIDGDNDCSHIAYPPTCAGISINLPGAGQARGTEIGSWESQSVPRELPTTLTDSTGGALLATGNTDFYLTARTDPHNGKPPCKRRYRFHVTSDGGGWGDPHITTVDGIPYDFQSAGEFVALKGDGIEIQTRQSPVSTQNSGNHKYNQQTTGLRSCVSLYTAVAARVGDHRVTIQPNISGVPDPAGLQIRVDGDLRTLGPDGIDLSSCDCPSTEIKSDGRIVHSADEESIEIHYANGTKLVVTPDWWGSQQKWYLNVNVYDTTATKGIMGLIKDNWLPELHNGETVGERAENLHELYVQLYETFADSWRVGSETIPSLFDYAPGTSTADFTLEEWPRENPANCLIEDEPVAEPVDEAVAEEACSEVVDEINRENCIFDVSATGYTGFADTYVRSEKIIPGATRATLVQDKNQSKPGTIVTFTATVQRAVSTIGKVTSGVVQFVLDGSNVGNPIKFDANGNAVWSTSTLPPGSHEVEARFLPSGFGERFRASSSHKVSHTVSTGPSTGQRSNLSFHLGINTPHGSLSDNFDGDIGYAVDYEYRLSNSYSLLLFAGNNQFDSSTAELDISNLSINGKHYYRPLAKGSLRYFANGGIGFYMADPGDDDLGVNIGGGSQYPLAAGYGLEAWYNYHHIFSSPNSTDFSTLQFGVYYRF